MQEVSTLAEEQLDGWISNKKLTDWFDTLNGENGLTSADYTCVTGKNVLGGEDYSSDLYKEHKKTMYNPIYFKTSKYTLIDNGTKWLTSTPDTLSKIYGGNEEKALNYVVLEDNATGERFIYVNVHFIVRDNTSGEKMNAKNSNGEDTGHYVQEAEAVYLRKILQDLQNEYDLPMFVGGDFNNSYGSIGDWLNGSVITEDGVFSTGDNKGKTYVNTINSSGSPEESIELSKARDQAEYKVVTRSSLGSGKFETVPDTDNSPIDLWWTSNFDGVVYLYEVVDNKFAEEGNRYPSDHLPVKLVVTLYGNTSN